nr:hypothetical transcript [Hymenolepis microstoma]
MIQHTTNGGRLLAHSPAAAHRVMWIGTCNDPSAGSPTETLLRLLLPLNDQVWSSSQHRLDTHLSVEPKWHQSKDLTKPFNRNSSFTGNNSKPRSLS